MYNDIVAFVRDQYREPEAFIPLHEPRFIGKEKDYVVDAIDSTFVSSVGAYVDKFEQMMAEITGAKRAIAVVNGTCGLQIALLAAGVEREHEVITQPLTFIATSNAIAYTGAAQIFVDVDKHTLGMSSKALAEFLEQNAKVENGQCINVKTGKVIKACVPMHTFGHPCDITSIVDVCNEYRIVVVEDSAESLGSIYQGQHTGTFGKLGVFSFNGNKTVTCGGGGAIITDDDQLADHIKHLTTTAKIPHKWEYTHDYIGYNYRMPNLNAALACAQLEMLEEFIRRKRVLADRYNRFFEGREIDFFTEPEDSRSNYWLNVVILKDRAARDQFLSETNGSKVMTRPIWTLMNKMSMFKECQKGDLTNSEWLEDRVVNIPSSVLINE